ncbi:MAG: MATE family efflux transporter [Clostridiales bacterium]|nr:MATE family efflux transporter [Clostridiales bacterium]
MTPEPGIARRELRLRILSMILPITAESVLQMTAGFISMAIIGNKSTMAVVALGLGSRITQIVWALFRGIATGASVFVAQAHGAGNPDRVRKVIVQTLLSATVIVTLLGILIYWQAPRLLGLFDPEPELTGSAALYLRTVLFGLPFMVITLVAAGAMQGMGNAKTPMKIALIMNFANVILGYALIYGRLGRAIPSVMGAALALAISQLIAAALSIYALCRRDGVLSPVGAARLWRLNIREVRDIYRVGIPTSFEHVFWQIAALILTRIILSYGETSLAAYQLGLQAESISYTPAAGFGIAATALIGQRLGAGQGELARTYFSEITKYTLFVTVCTALLLLLFPAPIMGLLTKEPEVIAIGAQYLFIMGLVQLPQNLSGVLSGALRGAGFTRVPMVVAGLGLWGVRIPLAFVLTGCFHMGITAIWIVLGLDLVFRFILSLILYRTKNIYRNAVILSR